MAGEPRVPVLAERAVTGTHLVDVTKVGGAFGYGQDVFREATDILRKEMPEEFAELEPSDLQAVVWFAEKELWGRKNWTSTTGEGGSLEAQADIEAVQRSSPASPTSDRTRCQPPGNNSPPARLSTANSLPLPT